MKKGLFVASLLMVSSLVAHGASSSDNGDDGVPSTLYQTTVFPLLSTVVSTMATNGEEMKQVVEAKDDAAEFLATKGEVRSLKLQNALNLIRAKNAGLKASDLELAEAILALE